jgi:hypothetical protein
MTPQNYHIAISAETTIEKAVAAISNVPGWWADDTQGNSQNLHDHFTVHFGETFVDFEITEIIPTEKIVWLVTDCNLHWLQDKKEWKGHIIIWEVSASGTSVKIDFTQVGLTPGIECYTDCEKGWNFYVGESLKQLITTGKGKPDTSKSKRV